MKKPLSIIGLLTLIAVAIGIFVMQKSHIRSSVVTAPAPEPIAPPVTEPAIKPEPKSQPEPPKPTGPFTLKKFETTAPQKELAALVGPANVDAVLTLNHMDAKFLAQGTTLVIPSDFTNPDAFSSFPATLPEAAQIPKLFLVSQRVQAFAAYEYGNLVRTGPVSSGKKATPTPSRLYFTNWKGKEVRSTVDDEWILKWNFNLDNYDGIGMHQYEMPGYPASHSCIRMFERDATWVYDWADQWVLTPNGQTIIAHGTPVIVFGEYQFGKTAPWKQLPTNPNALKVTDAELHEILTANMERIMQSVEERSNYRNTVQ